MMICESSTTLRSMRTRILLGVELDVCVSPSNKVHNIIHERGLCEAKEETVQEATGYS